MLQDTPEGIGDVELDAQGDVGNTLRLLSDLGGGPGLVGGSSSEGGASSCRLVAVDQTVEDAPGSSALVDLEQSAGLQLGRGGILTVSAA